MAKPGFRRYQVTANRHGVLADEIALVVTSADETEWLIAELVKSLRELSRPGGEAIPIRFRAYVTPLHNARPARTRKGGG